MINKIRLITIGFLVFVLTACATTENVNGSYERFTRDSNSNVYPSVFTDNQTGVEYLVIIAPNGVAVTPIYNSDGNLKINENK